MKHGLTGLGAVTMTVLLAAPVVAQEVTDDLIRHHLYAGTVSDGLDALTPLAAEGDTAARFGMGVMVLGQAVEGIVAAHLRHGFDPVGGVGQIPFLALGIDVPAGSGTPAQPLDYESLRGHYSSFVDRLDLARALFDEASEGEAFVVHFDVASIRLDFDGNGIVSKSESLGALLKGAASSALGGPMAGLADPALAETRVAELSFGFDNADAAWLAGYSSVLGAQGDFLLAHDFSRTFDAVFHRLFPRAGLPLGLDRTREIRGAERGLIFDPETDALAADLISAIHTLDWPIVEPERFARVPERLSDILAYSRRNWQLILAETDDDAEMLPGPNQTPPDGAPAVTEEMVGAWLETLGVAEQVLAGDLLIPHWRFSNRGFDLAAYFETGERTDIVMILAGLDALPYLREGPIVLPEQFAGTFEAFGDDFFGFALWFN